MRFAMVPVALTVASLLACCASDLRSRSIPNWMSGSMVTLGLACGATAGGGPGLVVSIAGALACLILLLPAFALGGVGGGDVKMMAGVGALLGPRLGLLALAVGLIVGGIVMLAHLARIGRLTEKLRATWRMVRGSWTTGSIEPLRLADDSPDAVTLPYSIPLAIGTFVVLVFAA